MARIDPSAGEVLLDRLQRAAFDYFPQMTNPLNGLVADNSRVNSPVSIAVVGFALSAYPVAVERGWMQVWHRHQYCLSHTAFLSRQRQDGSPGDRIQRFLLSFLDIDSGRASGSRSFLWSTRRTARWHVYRVRYFDAGRPTRGCAHW
jgi:hypothetical protein